MPKILVSIISYKEKELERTVKNCYEAANNKEDLIFSIVDENYETWYADLSFIPESQIRYEKYDLSQYRGILWARNRTTEDLSFSYDYILYICGHTYFEPNWDIKCLEEYAKAAKKSDKAVLTFCGPDYEVLEDGTVKTENTELNRTENTYVPHIQKDFIPGFWFPRAEHPPKDGDVHEHYWVHFTWCFADRRFVEEVPLDPEMNFNGEEPYVTVQAWCRGWRFYASSVPLMRHNTAKRYPEDNGTPAYVLYRPWMDKNKKDYWDNSDYSMKKLNLLLSGNLKGKYGDITREQVLEFCKSSGMDEKYTEYDPEYHKTKGYQHCVNLKDAPPVL